MQVRHQVEYKVNLRFQTESSLRQHQGNVLHGILQFVKTKEDAPKAVKRAVRMGLISINEVDFVTKEMYNIYIHIPPEEM